MHNHSSNCGCILALTLGQMNKLRNKNGPDKLANINISVEYELIKQKKSNLSANLRKLVVEKFEKTSKI